MVRWRFRKNLIGPISIKNETFSMHISTMCHHLRPDRCHAEKAEALAGKITSNNDKNVSNAENDAQVAL